MSGPPLPAIIICREELSKETERDIGERWNTKRMKSREVVRWLIGVVVLWCCATVLVVRGEETGEDEARVVVGVACETTSLDVTCGKGRVIRFVRANYGRTSRDPCNAGLHNWTEECVSPTSNETMFLKCDGRRVCDVVSSNYVFGDPCPGTEKYLEMEYRCVRGEDPESDEVPAITRAPVTPSASAASGTVPTPTEVSSSNAAPASSTKKKDDDATTPVVVTTGPLPPQTTATAAVSKQQAVPAAVLYCNSVDLRKLDLDSNQDTLLAGNLNRSVVVDYDYARNVFVWTDSKLKSIFSAPMSGGESRRVLAENVTSYGVAVDWVQGHVYWTDTGNDNVAVARLDGAMKRTLFAELLDEPRGIVLHPAEGFLYWSDWGEVPKIEKSGMDGTQRRVIVSYGLKWPNGLAIDAPSRRLYWIEAFHENLCSSGLEGEDVKKVIAASSYLKLPFSVDIYQEHVYWTEWTSNKENIFRAHKITGRNITRILDGETTLMGIKIYHPSKQEITASVCGGDNGGCSHLCLPSPRKAGTSNFTCACPNGLELQKDGRNCSASAVLQGSLLYCNRHDIRKYDLSTQRDLAVMTGLERATVVDYHFAKGLAVWTDTDKKKIYGAPLGQMGAGTIVIAESCTSYGIAVDWLHDHVYWTDTHNNVIDVAWMDGLFRKTLIGTQLDEPRAIVLHPLEGWMFWSDWGEVPKIEKAAMDGTHRRVIVSRDIRWPNGLAIDFASRSLFWVDGKLNLLSTADFEGGRRRNLISNPGVMRHPFSLDVLGEFLFWVEWSSGKESVYKASKADGSRVAKVFDGERTLMGLKVLHASKQPAGDGACGSDNGGCSHLCLPSPGTNFSCACPNDLHMSPDHFNCSSDAQMDPFDNGQVDNTTLEDRPVLFCANVDDIQVIDLKTYRESRLIGELTRAVAVDYFYANRTIVWTDIREDRICSAPIRKNGLVTELVSECSHPDGLAVDWLHGHIYWTDKGKDAIGVARMDGTLQRTLFDRDLDEPRAIALDPFEGWMFWTDWGRVPKIERAGMDGTRRSVIVSRLIQWPNGVAIDLGERRVYWADAKTHEICRCAYDGSGRTTVLQSYSLLKQPFSLDVHGSDMYWVEWRSGEEAIYKAEKASGRNPLKIADGRKWKNLMAIKVYHASKQPPGPNRCSGDNGGCSHLCLPTPRLSTSSTSQAYACACPNGLELALDSKTCLTERESTSLVIPTEEYVTSSISESNATTADTRPQLLYANKRDVRRLDLASKEDAPLVRNCSRASGIDFHFEGKLLLWTDYERGQIYSAPLRWSSDVDPPVTAITAGNTTSNGVAVDWVHGHVYWTDNRRNSVDVARLDGVMRRTLFVGGDVDEPRTIVLHPGDGWLFWADWGRVPKIVRAGMDGSCLSVVVATGVDWTHALAIDLDLRKLYWADGDQKRIFSVNFDGSAKRTVLHAPELLHLPFSMDVIYDNLYWTEFLPLAENIYRTNKLTGTNTVKVTSDKRWPNLMSIKIYHASKQPKGLNRCAGNKCSYLCLPAPRIPSAVANYSCACPNGMTLHRDGVTCIEGGGPESASAATTNGNTLSAAGTEAGNGVFKMEDNQSGFHSGDAQSPVGIIVGAVAAAALLTLAAVAVYYRHFLRRNLGNMVFNNPLYRKHTEEDFCIEKHHAPTTSRKSLVPLTSAESGEVE